MIMQLYYYTTMANNNIQSTNRAATTQKCWWTDLLGVWSYHHLGVPEFFHSPEAARYCPLPPHSYIMLYHVQLINS